MDNSMTQVAEFHRTFNHLIADRPSIPPMADVMFRINFMIEELKELQLAAEQGDLVEYTDGLGDLRYVLDGAFLNAGLHTVADAISTEIHRSNMSKACRDEDHAKETVRSLEDVGTKCYYEQVGDFYVVKRTSDGKVMKALGYSKPALAAILNQSAE